ncbi:MAG: LLM class flavin-dependent oxidoreductase [Chloroflexi bacterium]|nr:LLM class flavin-dependent oxidoreductase [Chloroflexota bacterium]
MKFGLFYEHQLPKPYDAEDWDPEAEHRLFKDALDQIELADKLGFDYIFEVEHHFLEEYAHSSAPEVFLAAVSQRTKNIRLGHGIALMPPRYNHPARVAERIATLDLVSDGRVEFGTGESASEMELGGFGVDRAEKKLMWEEATRQCVRMMTETPYGGYEGAYFGMPSRNVIPKPLQKPHPPLWVASSRRETTMVAARLGMGSLGFAFETPDEARERVEQYYQLIREECTPIGAAINPALAVLSSLMCCESDEEAMARGVEGTQFFSYSLSYYYAPTTGPNHQPGRVNLYKRFKDTPENERMGMFGARGGGFGGFGGGAAEEEPEDEVQRALWRAAQRGGCIGSPDFIRETLRKYEAAHLDTMIFVAQSGARKHEDVMESIQRFGTEVLPEFKERHKDHQKWREEQLAGVEHEINSSI